MWKIETRKYHVCRKVEFKAIEYLRGIEMGATSDEECQGMRDQSGHIMNDCNSNWAACHWYDECINFK